MDEPFSQLVATLRKVQGTMGPQLVRLGQARHPDKVRLPRLQKEAGQLKGAAAALLGRLMQQEAALDLILQTKGLVAFFARAEQQAAALMRHGDQAGPDAAGEHDDEALNEAGGHERHKELASSGHVASGQGRSAAGPVHRGGRAAARLAKLGHVRTPSASDLAPPRRRLSM